MLSCIAVTGIIMFEEQRQHNVTRILLVFLKCRIVFHYQSQCEYEYVLNSKHFIKWKQVRKG